MTWAQLHECAPGKRGVTHTDAVLSADANRTITGVAYDSRTVEPGGVFVALRLHADGTAFVRQALDEGAGAIVSGNRLHWASAGQGAAVRYSCALDRRAGRAAGAGADCYGVLWSSKC